MKGDLPYRRIRAVDIPALLAALPSWPFQPANIGSTNPEKSPSWMVFDRLVPAEVRAFVSALDLGGTTQRIVIRKLGPRQGMPPHIDKWMASEANWQRFQLPLVTDRAILMRWPNEGVSVHLEAGVLYEVDFSKLHEVVNNADIERVHLQIDQTDATV